MKIRTIAVSTIFGASAFLLGGCNNEKDKAAVEVEQLRQYTEQRFNDLQAHLTVISEQMDNKQPSSAVTLQPSANTVTVTPVNPNQPVVQITDITPANAPSRTLKDEIATLSQPVPAASRSKAKAVTHTTTSKKSSKAKKVILIPALSVRDVQTALKNAGFNPGRIDGRMGANTERAIKQFQRAEGLKADGVIGPRTWDKLSPHLTKAAF